MVANLAAQLIRSRYFMSVVSQQFTQTQGAGRWLLPPLHGLEA
jgi:hypothetical protein